MSKKRKRKAKCTHAGESILVNIRNLLIHGFGPEELRDLCFYESEFREAYNLVHWETSRILIVRQLITYTEQRGLFRPLLSWAKEQNPNAYNKYRPYYCPHPSSIYERDYQGVIAIFVLVNLIIILSLIEITPKLLSPYPPPVESPFQTISVPNCVQEDFRLAKANYYRGAYEQVAKNLYQAVISCLPNFE